MDPHHHHHCHLIHPTTVTAATTASSSCCHSCYTPLPPPPYFYPPNLSPPPHYPHSHHHLNSPKYPHHHQDTPPTTPDQATIASLHRRISALEASLRRHFPTVRSSLRDAAARTIQTHYRAFLVRRSRTVRQLKTLAVVKSSLNLLKLMVSDNTHIDTRAISRKAMTLILKIDSIQGGDSMIRDGKRSISRELDRFLGLVDGLSAKRNKLYSFGLKNTKTRILYNGQHVDTSEFVGSARDDRGSKERMRARVQSSNEYYYVPDDHDDEAELENFGILSNGKTASLPKRNSGLAKRHSGGKGKAKKSVTFAENGDHRSRGFVNAHEPNSSEEGSVDEEGELMDNLCRRVEKMAAIAKQNGDNKQEAYSEEEGEESSRNSNGEEKLKKGSTRVDEANYQSDEDFVFPVPMESRAADMTKTRKALKIGE